MKKVVLESAVSVSGSASKTTKNFDLEQFRKFSVLVIPDDTHTFSVSVNWAPDVTGTTNKVQETAIASASQANVISALLDAKADLASLDISNGDSDAHTYDVYVYGQE